MLDEAGLVIVQEVGDEGQEARARFAIIDRTTGSDLMAGFLSNEPVWAAAWDERRQFLLLGGQKRWLVRLRSLGIAYDLSHRPAAWRVRSP